MKIPQEPVAQLVEHRTFNAVVAGSSPARLTIIFNSSLVSLRNKVSSPGAASYSIHLCSTPPAGTNHPQKNLDPVIARVADVIQFVKLLDLIARLIVAATI